MHSFFSDSSDGESESSSSSSHKRGTLRNRKFRTLVKKINCFGNRASEGLEDDETIIYSVDEITDPASRLKWSAYFARMDLKKNL